MEYLCLEVLPNASRCDLVATLQPSARKPFSVVSRHEDSGLLVFISSQRLQRVRFYPDSGSLSVTGRKSS
jgi:hypothetical protein